MKVLHVIDNLFLGGAQRILCDLVLFHKNAEHELKHEIIVLHGSSKNAFHQKFVNANISVQYLSSTKGNIFRILKQLIFKLKNNNYSILHLHLRGSSIFGSIISFIFRKRQPVIVSVYEVPSQLPKSYKLIYKFVSRFTDEFTDCTPYGLVNLNIDKNKICFISVAVNLSAFSDANHEEMKKKLAATYDFNPSNFLLLSVARLNLDRQINTIIEAFPLVLKNNESTILLMVGSGTEEENLKAYCRENGISDKVVFAGDLIENIYAGCDLYIGGSTNGLISVAGQEAMASGRPVVTYNFTDMEIQSRFCNLQGYFIETRDSISLSQEIIRLMNDEPLRKTMAIKGQNDVLEHCSFNTYFDAILNLYSKTLLQ